MGVASKQPPKLVKIDRGKAKALAFDFSLTQKAFGLVSHCFDGSSLHAAVTGLAEELAAQFACDRACVGMVLGDHIDIVAVSQSAQFNKDAAILRLVTAAMEEARDQQASILFPIAAKDSTLTFTRAHESLAQANGASIICTVPLVHNAAVIGAITLERATSEPFPPNTVELLEIVATLIGPVLDLKRRDERWVGAKVADGIKASLQSLLGATKVGAKLAAISIIAAIALASVTSVDFRITAVSTLEGSIERVVTAPVDGYVAESFARPGDTLEGGQLIARLDERDLSLRRLQWQSELDRLDKEYRSAMAKRDRTEVAIITSKMDQARAETALVDEGLARLRVTAPFRSVLLDGDLSKSLGAPVKRGQVLFTLAPLDGYRIILQIDESDIPYIVQDQDGHLVLASFPEENFPLKVRAVTPVSVAEHGKNYFRVEAVLLQPDPRLKPGMQGIAKVYVGQRKLLWILTRKLSEWLQVAVWRYTP